MAVIPNGPAPVGFSGRAGRALHLGGAALSVALVVGVGVWGVKLLVRDVSGLPVVRALDSPMRIASDKPGGDVALNAGLAVNAIAAEGEAAPPEDTLLIAPPSAGLTAGDLEVAQSSEAADTAPSGLQPVALLAAVTEPVPDTTSALQLAPEASGPLTAEQILALADQIAAGVAPLSDLPASESLPQIAVLSAEVPGLARALRPMTRPGSLSGDAVAPATDAALAAPQVPLRDGLPVDTVFVQLGTYPSLDLASADWGRLLGRFPALLTPHEPVIQRAESGGDPFFRLRAIGFADLAEARRLCVAIDADGTPCVYSLEP